MDLQMPEMDGLEARASCASGSRTIQGFQLPIPIIVVAMTASAMQGDREKCLAAGWTIRRKAVRLEDMRASSNAGDESPCRPPAKL